MRADTLAKILFTSGSTKQPKAVPTTHRMLCSNQQKLRQTMQELGRTPPVRGHGTPWKRPSGRRHNAASGLDDGRAAC
ncbi:hypothetical protein CF642_38990, partial [Burkholderia pseudomallei]